MPVQRRNTPPTSQLKEQLGILHSLSAWTDGDAAGAAKTAKTAQYGELREDGGGTAEDQEGQPTGSCPVWLDPEADGFNAGVGVVILANALVIGLETDHRGWTGLGLCEHVFNSAFLLEMCLRLRRRGGSYFKEAWNVFDFALVCASTVDLWILPLCTGIGETRIMYDVSAFRLIRLFRMFHQLRLLMQAFAKAFQIVAVMGFLVLILDYVVAIVLTQAVGGQAHRWGDDEEKILDYFGSVASSMQTLFLVMTLTSWGDIALTLNRVIPAPVVLSCFVAYIMVTSYTMISLITGITSVSLLTSQQEFRQLRERTTEERKRELSVQLLKELSDMLEDERTEKGNVKPEDLRTAVRGDTALLAKLHSIDVNLTEQGILSLVDRISQNGELMVNLDYFVDKLTNLAGAASSSTQADMRFELLKVQFKMDAIIQHLGIEDPCPMEVPPEEAPAPMVVAYSGRRSSVRSVSSMDADSRAALLKDSKPRFSECDGVS